MSAKLPPSGTSISESFLSLTYFMNSSVST